MSKSIGAVVDARAAAIGGGEAQRRRAGLAAFGLVLAFFLGMLGVRVLAGLDDVAGSRTASAGVPANAILVAGVPSTSASAQWAQVPPLAQLAIARALGGDDHAYWARGAGDVSSSTPAQNLLERYSRAGVSVLAPAGALDLNLQAVHAGQRALPLRRPIPQVSRNRVAYRRGSVEEWYANGPLGVEQGFTVSRLAQPAVGEHSAGNRLTFDLTLGGSSLRPRALSGAGGIELLAHDGTPALRYSRLSATDATGRSLPAHMTLRGGQLLLSVDAAGARYPLTVDPLVQQATLSASNGSNESGVGQAVAIDGSTIVVGAWGAIVDGGAGYPNQQGAVYVFEKPASGWANATQSAILVASDADEYDVDNVYGDALGSAVAISGDTIVASAPRATAGGQAGVPYAGKLYVFVKSEHGGWVNSTETAQLSASNALEYEYLGASVATDGQTVVAGEPSDSGEGTSGPGAVYVFSKPAGGWKSILQTGELTASGGGSEAALGSSVAVEGKTVVAGAPFATVESKAGAGAVYVFTEPGGGWKDESPSATLTSGGAAHETFGTAVAFDGSTLLAGAANNYDPGTAPSSAYVFTKPAGAWSTTNKPAAQLLPSDPVSGEHFGGSVDISEGTAVVGAQFAPVGETLEQGAVYVYSAPAGGWSGTPAQTAKLSAKEGVVQQAESVAVSGSTVVDGAPYAQSSHGAAFVFGPGEGAGQGEGEGEKTGETEKTPEKTPEKEITFAKPASNTSLTYTSTAPPIEREYFIGFPLSVPPGQALGCSGNECTYAITCRHRSEACIGSATLEDISNALSSDASVARASAKHKKPRKPVIYGKASFSVPAGHSATLAIKLTPAARKLLGRKHSVRARLTITVLQDGGKPVVSAHVLTLRASRAKHKR
jgi:hypothetical protein